MVKREKVTAWFVNDFCVRDGLVELASAEGTITEKRLTLVKGIAASGHRRTLPASELDETPEGAVERYCAERQSEIERLETALRAQRALKDAARGLLGPSR